MPPDQPPLDVQTILAEARRLLRDGDYAVVEPNAEVQGLPTDASLLAEDKYGVVALAVYETWDDLSSNWADAQGALVRLLSEHFARSDAKAWEGYLVLLTPAVVGPDAEMEANSLRYDTSRARKIVATGNDLRGLSDVAQTLLPLMPLSAEMATSRSDDTLLKTLPELLSEPGHPRAAVDAMIAAFQNGEPLIERIHQAIAGDS